MEKREVTVAGIVRAVTVVLYPLRNSVGAPLEFVDGVSRNSIHPYHFIERSSLSV